MNANGEVSESRTMALLKEAAITGAQERSAQVTLADRALIAADGDPEAAKGMLREALEITGFLPYEPGSGRKPPRGCAQAIVNYERPGRST